LHVHLEAHHFGTNPIDELEPPEKELDNGGGLVNAIDALYSLFGLKTE
jgi:hypothetical protein